jgi:hypothetical protein
MQTKKAQSHRAFKVNSGPDITLPKLWYDSNILCELTIPHRAKVVGRKEAEA